MRRYVLYSKEFHSGERSVCACLRHSQRDSSPGTKRERITQFTGQSRTRLRRYLENSKSIYCVLATVTYGVDYPVSGVVAKDHLDRFGKGLTKYSLMPRSVLWFLEFQERGAPHFHFLLTDPIPKWALSWVWSWATDCMASPITSTHIMRLESANGATGYAMKYARKESQKVVPDNYKDVGRFWGVWGNREQWPMVASIEDGCDENEVGGLIENERRHAERDGMRIWDHERGFLAFPKRGG